MTTPDSTMLQIGSGKQLFFDNVLLQSVQDVKRTIHTPEKVDVNPLIVSDQPWEAVTYFSPGTWNLIYDGNDERFKCWYGDWHYDAEKEREMLGLHDDQIRLLYAESEDGIEWTKPELGQFHEDGEDTNIVLNGDEFGVHTTYVVKDPTADDPNERFKTLFRRVTPTEEDPPRYEREIRAAYSPDGINWTIRDDPPQAGNLGSQLGDVFTMDYDPDSRMWLSYIRHPAMIGPDNPRLPATDSFSKVYYPLDFAKERRRRIFRMESSDFHHWSEPRLVLSPDESDNLDETMYGMKQYRVPSSNLRVGFVNMYRHVDNTLNVQLAYSRDGEEWQRFGNRQPWLDTSADSWDRHMVNIVSAPVRVDDELWVYYGGSKNHHDWWLTGEREGFDSDAVPEAYDRSHVSYALGLAKLRVNGFVSLDAKGPRDGIIVTRPMLTSGRELVVNAACDKSGFVSAEITNRADEILDGFGWKDCDTFSGDSIEHTFSWDGTSVIPDLSYYKVRFRLGDASLYSLTFKSA